MIEIYTDGACLGNPGGPGGWGAVVVEDSRQQEFSGYEPGTTNQRMEVLAAIKGLEQTPPGSQIKVISDSQYVVKTMSSGWQRNANRDLWARLDAVVADRRVRWEWVKGHSGHPFNELADRLATGAAKDGAARGAQPTIAPVSDGISQDTKPHEGERPAAPPVRAASQEGTAAPAPRRRAAVAKAPPSGLTHIDGSGKARMVGVGAKDVTEREAVAKGAVMMQPETLAMIRANAFEKGDVLGIARVAGVMAAKKTHELIPLCHQIPLTQIVVEIDSGPTDDCVVITATARASWKTGVEMEALTAVTVAALTVYDMCKAVDRGMRIEGVRLVKKVGGKSGDFSAE
ncbi:MAG: cyclic pyranopterin monophosphate synthase MoaC [Dehalococcoidia bacterium]|nr:cyclic pyranopterin monophosphate synthase MoaC [Dehalococcoidia bacterium]